MSLAGGRVGEILGADAGEERRVTLGDVERQLRSLGEGARGTLAASKAGVAGAAGAGLAIVVAISYLLGRRRGRRRASVLEIRRL